MKGPNVIWIFGDQHRAQALSCAGNPNLDTPNIDALAAHGVNFTNAISGSPWCTPFRGSLLTSRYVHRCVERTPQYMESGFPTIADAFNDAGYRTAYFGKWHLGGHNHMAYIPRKDRGRFDIWLGYENNNAQYETCLHGHDLDGRDDTEPLVEEVDKYETDYLTDKLLAFLKRQSDESPPFFAALSVQPPHDPHVAPAEFAERHRPENIRLRPNVPPVERIEKAARESLCGYYAQVENLDWNVGRIMNALRRLGLDSSTHVMFFSDHGDMHGSHGYVRKSSPWEEAVRIPCIVRPAGGAEQTTVSTAPLNHVDFLPTTLGLCGVPTPSWAEGTDFSHHVLADRQAPAAEPRSAYIQQCVRKRFECLNRTWRGVRTIDGWKYICLEGQPLHMFNLNEDPYELANLAYLDRYNDKREELQAELAGWIERTGDTFELPQL